MLELKKITKQYKTGDSVVDALKGIDLKFGESEFVSILGPSGCGKTTLLNIIGGLDRYTSGDLAIDGVSTKEYKDADWDTYRNHSIGFVFQSYNLIPHQTVYQNVELALTISGVSKAERKQRVCDALEKVGLTGQMKKKPNQMSGGQMQRVAIARALVNDPDILLADEPTGALDSVTSVQVMNILKEISVNRLVIMVTHNPELASQYSTRIIKLKDGEVIEDKENIPEIATAENNEKAEAFEDNAENIPENNGENVNITADKLKRTHVKKKKRTSMSFFTALSLSLNNLMTKKGRTFMTSFAGSIGIIGIALILALSTGVSMYIDDVQKDTLSSYPITIENETMDLTSIMSSMSETKTSEVEHEEDVVYADSSAYDLFNTFFSQNKKKNNLEAFKTWLDEEMAQGKDSESGIYEYASAVHYGYDVTLYTYVEDENGKYRSTALNGLLNTGSDDEESSSSSMMTSMMTSMSQSSSFNMWEELLPGKDGEQVSDLIKSQYDLVEGSWPENKEDILLIVDDNNEISDMAFYVLGKMPQEELMSIITSAMTQKEITTTERKMSYSELLNSTFKIILPANLYKDEDGDGIYTSIESNDNLVQMEAKNGLTLKICGIVKKNKDASATAVTGPFCYTSALTEYIISETEKSDVGKAMLESKDKNFDILNGLKYEKEEEVKDTAEQAQAFKDYVAGLTDAQKAELYRNIMMTPSDEYVAEALKTATTASTREEMIAVIAEAYGTSVETITQYLQNTTDEELKAMIDEQAEEIVKTKYKETAEAEINEFLTTPSDTELLGIEAMIISQMPEDIISQKGYIASSWNEKGVMSTETAMAYLMSIDDAAFKTIYDNTIKELATTAYSSQILSDEESCAKKLAAALDTLLDTEDEKLAEYYMEFMPSEISESTYEEECAVIGLYSISNPSSISIYPETFEDKDRISDIITEYNEGKSDDEQITYTDYVGLLMSGITGIINAISYGLIAFVSISLVVSSIMIGIITYISVLERTKEIGILRAMGASKGNVSMIFTAETLIIGFIAGALGVGISWILCFPINLIIHALSGVNAVSAYLPWQAALVLVAISMFLSLIAGMFPSKAAAKKDPVEALRTE